jgi:hypothetical protein
MREQRERLGWDKRTLKKVIIVGEVAGHKLFVGTKNRPLSYRELDALAKRLVGVCWEHKIKTGRLGASFIELGHCICRRTLCFGAKGRPRAQKSRAGQLLAQR